jgi:molybdopterin-guanine dinucleotide biosynthesis protein A
MNNNQKPRAQIVSVSSILRENVNDLNCYGIDLEEEISKILSEEINKAVADQVLNALMFDNFANGIKSQNREGKIDSILEDKDFIPINIEDTEEFKNFLMKIKKKLGKMEQSLIVGHKGPEIEPGLIYVPYVIQHTTASISDPLLEAAQQKVKAINRDRKIDSILKDTEFIPIKLEDTEEYKKFSQTWFQPTKISARYATCHIKN